MKKQIQRWQNNEKKDPKDVQNEERMYFIFFIDFIQNSPKEEVYEAEAPKLSVNMEATGKTMDISVNDISIGVPGKQLVNGASLKLVYGRKYGLIGRNGIGKSTLLRYFS